MTLTGDEHSTFDISYNAGFDVPMSIITPWGEKHITSSKDSPDAYSYRDQSMTESCDLVQPCVANNYHIDPAYQTSASTFTLVLGVVPDPENPSVTLPDTPGRFGCQAPNPGFQCTGPGQPGCTTSQTSGATLYCWQGGMGDCTSVEPICYDGHGQPGEGSCPSDCGGSLSLVRNLRGRSA